MQPIYAAGEALEGGGAGRGPRPSLRPAVLYQRVRPMPDLPLFTADHRALPAPRQPTTARHDSEFSAPRPSPDLPAWPSILPTFSLAGITAQAKRIGKKLEPYAVASLPSPGLSIAALRSGAGPPAVRCSAAPRAETGDRACPLQCWAAALLVLVLVAVGCSPYQVRSLNRPEVPVSNTYHHALDGERMIGRWWQEFNNPALNTTVASALDNSLDLRQLWSRLTQAYAQARIEGAEVFPWVDLSGGAARTHQLDRDPQDPFSGRAGSSNPDYPYRPLLCVHRPVVRD